MKKAWYQSKTIWAGLLISLFGILEFLGVELPYEEIYKILAGLALIGIRYALK